MKGWRDETAAMFYNAPGSDREVGVNGYAKKKGTPDRRVE